MHMRIAFTLMLCLLAGCYGEGVMVPNREKPVQTGPTVKAAERICIDSCTPGHPRRNPCLLVVDGTGYRIPEDSSWANLIEERLRPDEIESVEIFGGPAASRVYGLNPCPAIVITTKHLPRQSRAVGSDSLARVLTCDSFAMACVAPVVKGGRGR